MYNFASRHIGINQGELEQMLEEIQVESLEQLIDQTVPKSIRSAPFSSIPNAESEFEYLQSLKEIASKNKIFTNFIGQGYYGTITPSVILRNIFQNPGWYTQYTPYQAEIAQGRLEALLNFQTMVSDLTGLPIANASLLDEATAVAESMSLFYASKNKKSKENTFHKILVDQKVFPQTLSVLQTRALPLGISIVQQELNPTALDDETFAIFIQYPNSFGSIEDYRALTKACNEKGIYVIVAADILALTLLTPPGEWGADAVVGNTQRFGVPMGYGGPHAAFFATKEAFKRQIPGRIIGVSVDKNGNRALRMALQTREQHIRREKATSNICTAQALLAIMAGMYATWHGPDGLKKIAMDIHEKTVKLFHGIRQLGIKLYSPHFFDTIGIPVPNHQQDNLRKLAEGAGINLNYQEDCVLVSLDETTTHEEIHNLLSVLEKFYSKKVGPLEFEKHTHLPDELLRTSTFLQHDVFHQYHTETKMMRYIKRLEQKDLSLNHSMIPLGSCTMKLNAATELIPVSWPEFANLHPFCPTNQAAGYQVIFRDLEKWLSEITGFAACSLQPNSGAQGEYAGLLTIMRYHRANGESYRNITLIPSSAHGTNPASAVMAGTKVVVIQCNEKGDIDLEDLTQKATLHKDHLAALMVTYPSTHGVFEEAIKEICNIIHQNGGLVYMDGANMNAQVGLTSPGAIDADVCHLNLHKTFAIPHGGGGPGMGPICVNKKLAPYLPGNPLESNTHQGAVSAAPFGSASILLISYGYIRLLGKHGLKEATMYAILNANYIKSKLEKEFEILYSGQNGRSAHELIVDLRPFKSIASAEDVAKRLIDYGFHAPTLSFPVAGTIMIEPTESESKDELDRFCSAILAIKNEIDEVATGHFPTDQNVLINAPHTLSEVSSDQWNYPYSREKAAYPLPYLREGFKFWTETARIDNAFGDRNLICTCLPLEAYE